ncbi:MAG: hypothetical protein WJU30_00548 [Candidatus Phytoplasma pruni]
MLLNQQIFGNIIPKKTYKLIFEYVFYFLITEKFLIKYFFKNNPQDSQNMRVFFFYEKKA